MVAIEDVYRQIRGFAEARGIGRVVLFGSRARGTASPKSDIDLAVSDGDVAGFTDDVNERLWSLLEVDVVDLGASPSSELISEIARDGKVLYEAV